MITKIFNAKIIFNKKIQFLKKNINFIKNNLETKLCLGIIITNNNFSSNLYAKEKIKTTKLLNIETIIIKIKKNIKLNYIKIIIKIINKEKKINKIICEFPLNKEKKIINLINKKKDIDKQNKKNIIKYILNNKIYNYPCTIQSINTLIKILKIKIKIKKITLFGFSNNLGKPLLLYLISKGASVNIINKKDNKHKKVTKISDIIISAIGKNLNIKKKNIKYGIILIDIGINKKNKLNGDINIKKIIKKPRIITPVPGGIGILTILNIIKNIIKKRKI